MPFASGSCSTLTSRAPASRSRAASHSAASRSPAEAEGRSIAQSSSSSARSQARRPGRGSALEAGASGIGGGKPSGLRSFSMPAGGDHALPRARDQDQRRLLLVRRPLPDHLLALGLLPRRDSAPRRRTSGPTPSRVASALLFFGSILLHELGHAFVAIRHGIGISGITLWMFGGVAQLERDSDSPGTEFKIAIAGPAGDGGDRRRLRRCRGACSPAPSEFRDAARADGDGRHLGLRGAARLARRASTCSSSLFNLVPAFPLDGGRVARAIAWWRTGNRASATRFAATLGRASPTC